jgi:F0F1-type ATP synthase membrane subunit b/b'
MKRSAIFCLSLIAGALFVSAPVRAQQHETEAERIKESTGVTEKGPNIIWGWANFIILAGGLGYLIKKHAGPYFAQRSLEIRKGMADAEAERIASDAKVADVNARLSNLQSEIESLRAGAKQEAEADAERVRQEAAAEIAKIQSHLAEEIASATKSAKLELRRYSAELALSLAEQKITARLTPETQDVLVRRFVATMAHAGVGQAN